MEKSVVQRTKITENNYIVTSSYVIIIIFKLNMLSVDVLILTTFTIHHLKKKLPMFLHI